MILDQSPFPVGVYRIEASLGGDLKLPDHAGSMLRGVFGHALRRTACMTGLKDCVSCPLRLTCPYPALFEAPAPHPHRHRSLTSAPNPYVIVPPKWGERVLSADEPLIFHMCLFGQALDRLPFVIHAWRQALGRGIGRDRVRAFVTRIIAENGSTESCIFDAAEGTIEPHDIVPVSPLSKPGEENLDWALVFETPYRTQEQGVPLGCNVITPRRLIADIIRRARLIADFHGSARMDPHLTDVWPVDDWLTMADVLIHHRELHWQEWRRYSARQKRGMNIGGLRGRWIWRSVPPALLALLRLGSLMHVGKETVFGFGRLRVESASSAEV